MAKAVVDIERGTGDVKKIIVAVHGIGDQTRYATVQSVLFRFCDFRGALPTVPLGYFHGGPPPSILTSPSLPDRLDNLAFAEVYWANIPRANAQEYSLEDARKWSRTIIARVRQQALRNVAASQTQNQNSKETDYSLLESVLVEMLQSINVVDRLCLLASKAGIFTFDLNKVLVDYLCDVQVVTEYRALRVEILKAFDEVMQRIHESHKEAEIYIIAHSEGTVISLLGLLEAVCKTNPEWIKKVRGFMTIGSPIDKHLILWPNLFEEYKQLPDRTPKEEEKIEWHNYYDKGDPIGFELDSMREWFKDNWGEKSFFRFEDANDHGFTRYFLPGKAHNDYWNDDAVFGHFIQNVVKEEPGPLDGGKPRDYKSPPPDKPLVNYISAAIPYMIAMALLFIGVFVLYKAVNAYLYPEPAQPAQVAALSSPPVETSGISNSGSEYTKHIFPRVAALTLLLAGLTALARLPRLAPNWKGRLLGIGIFMISAPWYQIVRQVIPSPPTPIGIPAHLWQWKIIVLAVAVILAYELAYIFGKNIRGVKTLLAIGGMAIAGIVAVNIYYRAGEDSGPLWPVFLGATAFLYLWWLVIHIFDLAFIWHLYIRKSRVMTNLKNIRRRNDEPNEQSQRLLDSRRLPVSG